MLFFNAGEAYRISHPVPGGDACLSLGISEPLLRELTPAALLRDGAGFVFRQRRLRIDPRAQALVALLRHGTQRSIADPPPSSGRPSCAAAPAAKDPGSGPIGGGWSTALTLKDGVSGGRNDREHLCRL